MDMEQQRKRGRPAKFSGPRVSLTIRLREEVRQDLEAAAATAGRSLSEEVEHRLELSFSRRDYLRELWGHAIFTIADAAARSLVHIQRHSGKSWLQDDRTADLFIKTLVEIAQRYRWLSIVDEEDVLDKSEPALVDMYATLGGMIGPERKEKTP
jgi:hypothetical protein